MVIILKVVAVSFQEVISDVVQFKNKINNKYTKEYVRVGPNLNKFGVFAPSLWDFQDP